MLEKLLPAKLEAESNGKPKESRLEIIEDWQFLRRVQAGYLHAMVDVHHVLE